MIKLFRPREWYGPSLAMQILALLLGGLIVAQLVTLLLTFLLPPEPPSRYGLRDIAAALQGTEYNPRSLARTVQADAPSLNGRGWLTATNSRADLARLLGVQPENVQLSFYTPLPFAGTVAATGTRAAVTADDNAADGRTLPVAGTRSIRQILPVFGDQAFARFRPNGQMPGRFGSDDTRPRLIEAQYVILAHGGPGPAIPGGGPPGMPGGGFPGGGFPGGGFPSGGTPSGGTPNGSIPSGGSGGGFPNTPQSGQLSPSAPVTTTAPIQQSPVAASPPPMVSNPLLGPPAIARGAPFVTAMSPLRLGVPLSALPTTPAQAPSVRYGRSPSRAVSADPVQPTAVSSPRNTSAVALPAAAPTTAAVHLRESAQATAPVQQPPERFAAVPQTGFQSAIDRARTFLGLGPVPFVEGDFLAALQRPDGSWVIVQPTPPRFLSNWQQRVLLWFAIAFTLVTPLGWLFARRLSRPLDRFADAAAQLGRDPSAAIAMLDGPAEIGRAAHAFNLMQNRLRSFVDDRTAMVGAISHDLRTPLTRMRFRIEDAPDDIRDGMLQEVEEMEEMITSVLAFIRDASTPGVRERLDLRTILDDVATNAAMVGGDVVIEANVPATVEVDILGMRRVLSNLIENAIKYGDRARVRVHIVGAEVLTSIMDDGPGLPDSELEQVFQPFYRTADARNSNAPGTGLGLAVCRSIARSHGGDVRLCHSAEGFMAEVRMPLAYRVQRLIAA